MQGILAAVTVYKTSLIYFVKTINLIILSFLKKVGKVIQPVGFVSFYYKSFSEILQN